MKRFALFLLLALFLCGVPAFAADESYNYPIADPWFATIVGTPEPLRAPLVEDIDVRLIDLTVFPERKVPDPLWYNSELRSALAYQKQKAPLIFVIGGTGAGFNADKMLGLQSIFYKAGFHVVTISSPTHATFVTAASESGTPGIMADDARDLYRVMKMIWEKVKGDIEVSEFYLTGYSLGGTQAAYVSKLDETEKAFNFKKVIMINPAVDVFASATRFDDMLEKNIPGGANGAGAAIRRLMDRFAQVYKAGDFVSFDHEFLYNIYKGWPEPPTDEKLAALIGVAFRISSMNMMFASDLVTDSGFAVPKGMGLDNNDPLQDYMAVLARVSFANYLDGMVLPVAQTRNPQVTRQMLIDGDNLKSIESYLQQAQKVSVVTNQDDIILSPAELEYLKQIFGARAKIYPRGGHLGNIVHKDVATYMVTYLTRP